ncbi:MAG: c-type cytochrome [Campylobacteraceae bacterium]
MKISKIIGIALSAFIVFLMGYIFFTQEGGYITAKEVEDNLKTETKQQIIYDEKSAEEQQLEDLKKSVGDLSYEKTSRLYASKCSACHGKNGEGRVNQKGEIVSPEIKGKDEKYILSRLHDYKNDKLPNPLMIGLLRNIDDSDLGVLAHEISNFK